MSALCTTTGDGANAKPVPRPGPWTGHRASAVTRRRTGGRRGLYFRLRCRARQTRAEPAESLTGAERDARIEQLLVAGLDHYFAGEFEEAINLWTRVLFLDRGHDRARAYIERARSAQAEEQRESEALLHEGLQAFTAGDVDRARALVTTALERGASHDLALGVLDRIGRLDSARPAVRVPARPERRRVIEVPTSAGRGASRWGTRFAATLIPLAALAGWWLGGARGVGLPLDEPAPAVPRLVVEAFAPLPVPSPGDAHLARARALFRSGRLRDALRALDRIGEGDKLRPVADQVRAEVQRELLRTAPVPPPDMPSPDVPSPEPETSPVEPPTP